MNDKLKKSLEHLRSKNIDIIRINLEDKEVEEIDIKEKLKKSSSNKKGDEK